MRIIDLKEVTKKVEEALINVCVNLPSDVEKRIRTAKKEEASLLASSVLDQIIENIEIARTKKLPLCQDTGMVVCFVEIGNQVHFEGDLENAINQGVRNAYINGYLRKSVVKHPFKRINTLDNTPAIIHTKIVVGDQLVIRLAPKGAGSENMSSIAMLTPADGYEGVKKFVLETVRKAGGKPCPPIIVGVGIGGNLEKSALLAKEALLEEIDTINSDEVLRKLEEELMLEINKLGIGPMGIGGTKTCLAVKTKVYPCHMASLPVAVNIQCHCSRHTKIEI